MVRKYLTAILTPLLVSVVLVCAAPAQTDNLRAEFEEIYEKVDALTKSLDVDGYGEMLAPDFKAKAPDGKEVGPEEYSNSWSAVLKQVKKVIEVKTTIVNFELDDDGNAVVRYFRTLKFVISKDGKEAKVGKTTKGLETWTKTEDGWKLLSFADDKE